MVYRGKPSKGCEACRRKKVRCDQLPSGCTNCLKARRECPGYRNQLDLIFQNESEDVKKKVEAKAASRLKQESPGFILLDQSTEFNDSHQEDGGQCLELPQQQLEKRSASPKINFSMTPLIDDQALGFFFSYIDLHVGNSIKGMDNTLFTSVKTLGLATLASVSRSTPLMQEAKKRYSVALQDVNASLISPVDVKKDSTLLATMVLSVFETVAYNEQRSLTAWVNHVNGSAALIALRGKDQLTTFEGLRLYAQATNNIAICCLQAGLEVPKQIMALDIEARKYVDLKDPTWRHHESMIALTDFRAQAARQNLPEPDVLARALELDEAAQLIMADAPADWNYKTVYTTADPELVYKGCYHIYTDYMSAVIWDGMRCHRILLNEMIREVILKGLSKKPPLFQDTIYAAQLLTSTRNLHEIQKDVMASVPQYMGYLTTSSKTDTQEYKFPWSFFKSKVYDPFHPVLPTNYELPMVRTTGGVNIIWAVFLAGASDIASEADRRWAIGILHSLGNSMGIDQAITLADRLERKFLTSSQSRMKVDR